MSLPSIVETQINADVRREEMAMTREMMQNMADREAESKAMLSQLIQTVKKEQSDFWKIHNGNGNSNGFSTNDLGDFSSGVQHLLPGTDMQSMLRNLGFNVTTPETTTSMNYDS